MLGWIHALVVISFEVAIWVGIIFAVNIKSWYPLLLSPLVITITIFTHSSSAKLIPTDSKKISQVRIRAVFEFLIIVSVVIAGYFVFGGGAHAI